MTEKDSERALSSLDARLKQARQAQKGPASKGTSLRGEATGFGQAMRIGAELISGLVVGTLLGWLFDGWLDTKPIMMIVFIFLGGAAGLLNVFRTAQSMANDAKQGPKVGSENGIQGGPTPAQDGDLSNKQREN